MTKGTERFLKAVTTGLIVLLILVSVGVHPAFAGILSGIAQFGVWKDLEDEQS